MKKGKLPKHLNETLRKALALHDFGAALEDARTRYVFSKARRDALHVAFHLAKTPKEFTLLHRFTEGGSRLEYQNVLKWARTAKTEPQLREVLEAARNLRHGDAIEQYIVHKLRRFGYRTLRERVKFWFLALRFT